MGNCRCPNTALLTPRTAIKNSRQHCEQDIAPIEMYRTLVEVRQPKEHSRNSQRPAPANATLQKVLYPAAEEKLLGNGNKEERKDPRQQNLGH